MKKDTSIVIIDTNADNAGLVIDEQNLPLDIIYFLEESKTKDRVHHIVIQKLNYESLLKVCEKLWVKLILDGLKIKTNIHMPLYCDNKSAMKIIHNLLQHDKTNIKIEKYFTEDNLDKGLMVSLKVKLKFNLKIKLNSKVSTHLYVIIWLYFYL